MRKGDDTLEREKMSLLVWAMFTLVLSEETAGTELHKEHHSRTAGLNRPSFYCCEF